MLRLRLRNSSTIAVTRLAHEFKKMRARINTRDGGNLLSVLQELYKTTSKVLRNLGEPYFDPNYLARESDPEPEKWNQNMEQLETDLRTLFSEDREIKRLRVETYNTAQVLSREIQERNNLASSMITDLRLIAGQLDQEVIVAGDDFSNLDKIDLGFPLTYPAADVNIQQGVVTLKRAEAINVVDPDTTGIVVTPIGPVDVKRAPTPDNSARFYEGKFYATVGEARPEGGRWHLEERVKPGIVLNADSRLISMRVTEGMTDEDLFAGFPDLREKAEQSETGFPLSPEDILVIDRGASLEELAAVRKKMVDGNPDTFWECEFVLSTDKLNELAAKLLDPVSPNSGGGDPNGTQVAEVTPEDLRARAAQSDVDTVDFEVEIVLDLPNKQTVNFITINPINFGETSWLEITDVSTAKDEDSGFETVEGFGSSTFDNILTDEANAELSEGEQSVTLSPNSYSYRGTGVFTFPPREASKVRVRILQRTPVPVPYERVSVQLNRTLTNTTSKVRGSCFPGTALVATPQGDRPIFSMRPGDEVYSIDDTDQVHIRHVTCIKRHRETESLWILSCSGRPFLYATGNHLVRDSYGNWVRVDQVPRGLYLDIVEHEKLSGVRCIDGIDVIPYGGTLYNLYTTGEHNFIVGGTVVHNFSFMRKWRTFWHRAFRD